MRARGAVDINKRASYYKQQGFQKHDESAKHYSEDEVRSDRQQYADAEATLPVIEEEVHVGKEKVQTGGVRIFQRETSTPVEKDVTLREEHVSVERHKADRPVTDADRAALSQGDIELRETAERAVVAKEAHVTEEVEINKTAEQHTETVRESAKKVDVEVEKIDDKKPRR